MTDTTNATDAEDRYVMKVSVNGQVSIPARARARWQPDRVVIVDLGDRLIIRPLSDDPISNLRGRYRGQGPPTSTARDHERAADSSRARRKRS